MKHVIDAAKRVSGQDFVVIPFDRRPGDPAVLVADASEARQVLGWSPMYDNLEDIVLSAWNYFRAQT